MLYNILNEIIVEYTANLQKAPYRNITAAENIIYRRPGNIYRPAKSEIIPVLRIHNMLY